MRGDVIKNKTLNRRVLIIIGLHLTITSLFTFRLYHLQIKKNKKYKTLSDSNRIKIMFTPPFRGKILDSRGESLATNKISYKVLCDLQYVEDLQGLIEELVKITKSPIRKNVIDRIKKTKDQIVIIYDEINWQQLSNIEFNMEKFAGIYVSPFYKRYYPFGKLCSHVIGYIKTFNKNEYFNQYKDKVGISGIEYHCDNTLKGIPGIVEQEVDAKRHIVKELSRTSSRSGNDVALTIDIKLQQVIAGELENNEAAVVVLDIRTGNVLSLYSSPSYDNNMFINGFSQKSWNNINNSENLPLINRAISLQTEPASTFKVISALSALKDNIVDFDTEFTCEGEHFFGDTKFRCWKHDGHGQLNLRKAIITSCNSYFYGIAQRISIDSLVDMSYKFGFGQISNLGLPGEVSGLLPNKNWRRSKMQSKWQLGDTLNIIIGHGYILVTPIQLAIFVARIASGREVIPNLKLYESSMKDKNFAKLNINTEHLEFIRECMFNVVNSYSGTAFYHLNKHKVLPLMKIAGKTGSAQVISTRGENIKILQQYKKNRSHGIFIGYGPYEDPKYAISIFMGNVGGGGKSAIIAQRIFNFIKEQYI